MKKLLITLAVALISLTCLFATEGFYEKGDTVFTFKAGAVVPDFLFFPDNSNFSSLFGAEQMHCKIGGHAGISYQTFMSRKWAVGAELAYNFVNSNSKYVFTTIPITCKLSYVPVQNGKYDVFFNLNGGLSLIKYNNQKFLTPGFVSATINPVYYFGSSWGIGLETGVYSNIELYGNSKKNDSCLAAFTPIVLTVTYRH